MKLPPEFKPDTWTLFMAACILLYRLFNPYGSDPLESSLLSIGGTVILYIGTTTLHVVLACMEEIHIQKRLDAWLADSPDGRG